MILVFRMGGITFDDVSLLKVLTLPTLAQDDTPITFHDEAGNDYQVPGGKKLLIGKIFGGLDGSAYVGRIGASDTPDNPLTAESVTFGVEVANVFYGFDVLGVIAAGKYVTGESNHNSWSMLAGTAVYGLVVDA